MGRVPEPDTTRGFSATRTRKNENLLPEHEPEPEKFKIVYPNPKKSKN